MLDRVLPAFDELLRRRDWDCMLLVLHGAVNRAILSRALTGGRAFLGAFEQSPACINIIDVGDDNLVVRATNLAPTAWLHEGDRRTTMETLLAQYRRQREAAPRQPWTLPALLRSEHEAQAIQGLQLLIVAHSGGCMMVAHWAHATQRPVQGVLPATPPDFDKPMPRGYPTLAQFDTRGWLPAPCRRLRFRSVTVASRHDPPGAFSRVDTLAADRDRRLVELLEVAPLNHASGFGTWTRTFDFIAELAAAPR